MNCQYLTSHRAGEPLDYSDQGKIIDWAEWAGHECNHSGAFDGEGCPYLDDYKIECPLKEKRLKDLEGWAIQQLAGDRNDRFTRVRELMREAEGDV